MTMEMLHGRIMQQMSSGSICVNVDPGMTSTSGASPCKSKRQAIRMLTAIVQTSKQSLSPINFQRNICGCGGIGRLIGFRFQRASVQVRVLSSAPTIKGRLCLPFIVGKCYGTRTHLNATCRWHVAAEGLTEANLYFAPQWEQNANRV